MCPLNSNQTRHQTITIGPMPAQRGVTGSTIIATTTMSGMATLPGKQNAPEVIDVVAEIRSLRQRVAELERKLADQPAPH